MSHVIRETAAVTSLAEQQIGAVHALGGSSLEGVEVGFDVVGTEDDELVDEVEATAPYVRVRVLGVLRRVVQSDGEDGDRAVTSWRVGDVVGEHIDGCGSDGVVCAPERSVDVLVEVGVVVGGEREPTRGVR